jgi:radical SAM superfamily enzyme YgiQ (UPF0313 family)
MKKRGDEVAILDTHIETDWKKSLDRLLKQKWDEVGISVIIGQPMANAAEITAYIRSKKNPPKITWGGIMPTVMPEEIKAEYRPDEVYQGQFCAPSAIDWTLLGDNCNQKQQPYYQMIMSSRGCPFNCTFCYKQSINSQVIYRSSTDVCNELDWLAKNRGIKVSWRKDNISVFTFGDDNFLTKPSRAIEILSYCRKRGYYVEECIGHINNLTQELINAMAGVVQTFIFSIETVDSGLQELLNKKIRLDEVKGKMAALAHVGIVANVSFMIGLPGETWEHRRQNQMFMGDLREAHPYLRGNCYVWLPLPKTKLSEYAGISNFPVRDYENANFWLRHDDPYGKHFRPHISDQTYHDLVDWGIKFNEDYKRERAFYILDEVLAGRTPILGRPL